MSTPQEVIKNFLSVLNTTTSRGTTALNLAVKAVSNFKSWKDLKKSFVEDCASYHGDGTGFLVNECGIILDNEDTGAITGSDAGTSTTKTAESIVPESGDLEYPSDTSFKIQGLTVKVPKKSSLSAAERYIVSGLYSWWIDSALTLVKDSYGLGFTTSGVSVKKINVKFEDEENNMLAYVSTYNDSKDKKCIVLNLVVNMNYYNSIDKSDPNGSVSGHDFYLDRTLAHELTHAVMAANIDYFGRLPLAFIEGSAELTHGIDDERKAKITELASSSSALESALEKDSGVYIYAAGYMLLRYLAKQSASSGNSTNDTSTQSKYVKISGTTLTVSTAAFKGDILLGGYDVLGNTTSNDYTNAKIVTLNAKKMKDSVQLVGNSLDNIITAGSGGSKIWGGSGGNDTLTGGSGKDYFYYSSGNGDDTIKNFTASDVLVLGNGFDKVTRNGKTITMTVGTGTLTVSCTGSVDTAIQYSANASDITDLTQIKIGNTNKANTFTYDSNVSKYYGGNKKDTLKVKTAATINLSDSAYSKIENVNASTSTKSVNITGNSSANTLTAGKGNSTLWGGADSADDTLIGGSGSTTFVYGLNEGNDTIKKSKTTDVVNLYNVSLSDIISVTKKGSNLITTIGNDTLTINGNKIPTLQLSDGSTLTYNSKSGKWS